MKFFLKMMSDKHSRKRGPTCPLSQNLSQTNDLWAHFTRNLCGNVTGTGARKIYLTYAVALKPAIGGKLEEDGAVPFKFAVRVHSPTVRGELKGFFDASRGGRMSWS
jgi:hypothetical protein